MSVAKPLVKTLGVSLTEVDVEILCDTVSDAQALVKSVAETVGEVAT